MLIFTQKNISYSFARNYVKWSPNMPRGGTGGEVDPLVASKKKLQRQTSLAMKKIYDREYLGAAKQTPEGKDWMDVVVDKPLDLNPKMKYNLRLMGPCPEGFSKHYCWLEGNEILCINQQTGVIETIDAENEVWIEKPRPEFDIKELGVARGVRLIQRQYGDIGKDHFYVWDLTEKDLSSGKRKYPIIIPSPIRIFSKKDLSLVSEVTEMPFEEDYYYGKLFSTQKQLLLQSRMRPERDNVGRIWEKPELDHHTVHKELQTFHSTKFYKPESVYSKLFYYHFPEKAWYQLPNIRFFSCSTIVKSLDEKKVYFLSKLSQGYVLDTETWKVTGLSSIGRPGNISDGCFPVLLNNRIVVIGGGWPVLEEVGEREGFRIGRNRNPIVKSIVFNKFSPRIIALDLNSKTWSVPLIDSEEMEQWTPLAHSFCVPYKNKIFIIGGENKRGETRKVWVLEQATKSSKKEKE